MAIYLRVGIGAVMNGHFVVLSFFWTRDSQYLFFVHWIGPSRFCIIFSRLLFLGMTPTRRLIRVGYRHTVCCFSRIPTSSIIDTPVIYELDFIFLIFQGSKCKKGFITKTLGHS